MGLLLLGVTAVVVARAAAARKLRRHGGGEQALPTQIGAGVEYELEVQPLRRSAAPIGGRGTCDPFGGPGLCDL